MEDSTLKGVLIMKDSFKNIVYVKGEINDFLGGLFGISGEDFGNLSIKKSMFAMKQLQEIEGVSDFLALVKALMKQYS
jgi:5'-deoxynucleotidase YfbR-like HD superfamily hydrolase